MRAGRLGWSVKFIAKVGLGLGVLFGALMAAPAWASLSQGYATTSPIATGSLVSLDPKATGSVQVADLNNQQRLFGVVVSPSAASISLGGADSNGQVQVVTTGGASVLVSSEGGDIHVGDYIAVSSLAGVGQKASGKVRVIGTAQADFKANAENATKRTIDTATGKREVSLGQIPVLIAVATYNADNTQQYTVPSWLQSFSNVIAGKNVSPVRIIMAGLILVVALIVVAVLLYAAVRNSIISIGRNPLSRGSVLRGLLQVTAIALAILAAAVGSMYVVITR